MSIIPILTTDQIQALTTATLAALTTDDIRAFTTAQMVALTTAQVPSFKLTRCRRVGDELYLIYDRRPGT